MNAIKMIETCAARQAATPEDFVSLPGPRDDIPFTHGYLPPTDHGVDDAIPLGSEVP